MPWPVCAKGSKESSRLEGMSNDSPAAHYSVPGWLRTLTWVATLVTIVCFIALVIILVGYFIETEVWSGFYAAGLFGLPLGFGLMILALIISSIQRRRLS